MTSQPQGKGGQEFCDNSLKVYRNNVRDNGDWGVI